MYRDIVAAQPPAIPLFLCYFVNICEYTLDSSGLTLDDWLNAGEEVGKKRLQRLEPDFLTTRFAEVLDLSLPIPEWRKIFARVEQTLSRRVPAIAATFGWP
jgi:hypothetical protein